MNSNHSLYAFLPYIPLLQHTCMIYFISFADSYSFLAFEKVSAGIPSPVIVNYR